VEEYSRSSYVTRELQDRGIDIFIASGDRKGSLQKLAEFIGIPSENVLIQLMHGKKGDS